MTKAPLIERMTKGGAAKTWIKEVEAKDRVIELLSQKIAEYLNIINLLACEKEQLADIINKCAQSKAALKQKVDDWKRQTSLEAKKALRLMDENAELAQVSDDKTLIIKARVSEIKDLRSENAALSELLSPLVDVELERDNLKREILNADEVSRLMGILDRYQERGPSDLATSDTMLWRKFERLHALLTAEDDPLASPDATWEELGLGFIEDPPPLESDCDET